MDDALLEVVIERLNTVPLGAQAERFLLAACESESALAAEIQGQGQENSEPEAAVSAVSPSVLTCGRA